MSRMGQRLATSRRSPDRLCTVAMKGMMRNNPAGVVYNAFSEKFFQGMVRAFQTDKAIQNIVMKDPEAREQATRHFFKRAQGLVAAE